MELYQRLSGESHQRIRDAYAKADLILLEALAVVETQYNAEHGLLPSELARMFAARLNYKDLEAVISTIYSSERRRSHLSFEDYCAKNSNTALLLAEARLKASRIVGKAIVLELSTEASGLELWECVQEPPSLLQQMEREFKLTALQGQLLWTELMIDPGFEGVTKPAYQIHSAAQEFDSTTKGMVLDGTRQGRGRRPNVNRNDHIATILDENPGWRDDELATLATLAKLDAAVPKIDPPVTKEVGIRGKRQPYSSWEEYGENMTHRDIKRALDYYDKKPKAATCGV